MERTIAPNQQDYGLLRDLRGIYHGGRTYPAELDPGLEEEVNMSLLDTTALKQGASLANPTATGAMLAEQISPGGMLGDASLDTYRDQLELEGYPLKIPWAKGAENLASLENQREKGSKRPGLPVNRFKGKPVTLQPLPGRNIPGTNNPLPPITIGGLKPMDWVNRVKQTLTPEEIKKAALWYRSGGMRTPFWDALGPEVGEEMMVGMNIGSVQKSPRDALTDYLRIKEQHNRGIPFEDMVKGSTVAEGMHQFIKDEPITKGAGFKIFDFTASGYGMKTRPSHLMMPQAGEPYTVDRHAARGGGYVDEFYQKFLERNYDLSGLGKKGLQVDIPNGAVKDTQYNVAGDQGRALTEYLNRIGFGEEHDILDESYQKLDAPAVQAIDWMSMLKLYGQPWSDPSTAVAGNIIRTSAELSWGGNNSWFDRMGWSEYYNKLPIAYKQQVTRESMDQAFDMCRDLIKGADAVVSRVHGTGAWQANPPEPSYVHAELATPKTADAIASCVGYLAGQTEVWAVRPTKVKFNPDLKDAKSGKPIQSFAGNGFSIDLIERGSKMITKGNNVEKIWKAVHAVAPDLFQGFQPYTDSFSNEPGLRIIIPADRWDSDEGGFVYAESQKEKGENLERLKELHGKVTSLMPKINQALESVDFNANIDEYLNSVEIRYNRNDWNKDPNGERHLQRVRNVRDSGIDTLRNTLRKQFIDSVGSRLTSAIGSATGNRPKGTARRPLPGRYPESHKKREVDPLSLLKPDEHQDWQIEHKGFAGFFNP